MCGWITDRGSMVQSDEPNRVITTTNQLFYYRGTIYLVPRNTVTDNYTIPLGINKSKWDVRPSHLHDIACRYHAVLVVDLPIEILYNKYLYLDNNNLLCKDIPVEYIKIVNITFNECNNLLYNSMICLQNIPKYICNLYRLAVNFNINWLFTNNNLLYINTIYNNKLYT